MAKTTAKSDSETIEEQTNTSKALSDLAVAVNAMAVEHARTSEGQSVRLSQIERILATVVEKLDGMTAKVAGLQTHIEVVSAQVDRNREAIAMHEKQITEHGNRIAEFNQINEGRIKALNEIRESLKGLGEKDSSQDKFQNMVAGALLVLTFVAPFILSALGLTK